MSTAPVAPVEELPALPRWPTVQRVIALPVPPSMVVIAVPGPLVLRPGWVGVVMQDGNPVQIVQLSIAEGGANDIADK